MTTLEDAAIRLAEADIRDHVERSRESCVAYLKARDEYMAARAHPHIRALSEPSGGGA